MEDVDFSFLYLNMDKALKHSTPGKVAYIWQIERFQIDAIKFERTQIHILAMFPLPSSSWSLKVPNTNRGQQPRREATTFVSPINSTDLHLENEKPFTKGMFEPLMRMST